LRSGSTRSNAARSRLRPSLSRHRGISNGI
jgi:hypothetical protein